MGKILPILLIVIGIGAGAGAGIFLRPDPSEPAAESHEESEAEEEQDPTLEYVKLNNQFVVPIVEQARVSSLVIMSLSLEVPVGATEQVYAIEPKLRDNLLQVLFDHANSGGFRGVFTASDNMTALRRALLEAARKVLGRDVSDVLVSDILRQDM